jgi:hypothetical protein
VQRLLPGATAPKAPKPTFPWRVVLVRTRRAHGHQASKPLCRCAATYRRTLASLAVFATRSHTDRLQYAIMRDATNGDQGLKATPSILKPGLTTRSSGPSALSLMTRPEAAFPRSHSGLVEKLPFRDLSEAADDLAGNPGYAIKADDPRVFASCRPRRLARHQDERRAFKSRLPQAHAHALTLCEPSARSGAAPRSLPVDINSAAVRRFLIGSGRIILLGQPRLARSLPRPITLFIGPYAF